MDRLSFRPIRLQDFSGELVGYPVKGWTALLGDDPVGIGGIMFKGSDAIVFARTSPMLRRHPLILYKCAYKLISLIKDLNLPVIAVADKDIPRSEATLEWFGFEYIGGSEYGEVYEWMPVKAQI